jgi:hypothetical protein
MTTSLEAGGSSCLIDPATGQNHCTPVDGSGWDALDVLKILVIAAIIVAPIITTMYLGYRLRRQQAAAPA